MEDIVSPTLVIDEDKCRRNIRHMADKARKAGVAFRPHFKTHQNLTVGNWFREAGTEKIAVSSLDMAALFARDGWQDIMVAFPVNIREINAINELAGQVDLSIMIADTDVIPFLRDNLTHAVGFYIKLDVGNHRSGFLPDDVAVLHDVIRHTGSSPMLRFKGFVAHAGQTYHTHSLNDVHKIFSKGSKSLVAVTESFRQYYPSLISSWGDTPTCCLENDFEGIDEIRPGNFVFFDLMQYHLASCDWEQIAVAVAAPVVSRQTSRKEVVLYGGAVHLSKDSFALQDNDAVYGEVVTFSAKGWERFPEPLYLQRLSQEHGIFSCPDEHMHLFAPGELAGIIPVHSCLTADALKGRLYNMKTSSFL